MEAAARPLPKLDTTPPVTKTYFADMDATSSGEFLDGPYRVDTIEYDRDGAGGEQKITAVWTARLVTVEIMSGFKSLGAIWETSESRRGDRGSGGCGSRRGRGGNTLRHGPDAGA